MENIAYDDGGDLKLTFYKTNLEEKPKRVSDEYEEVKEKPNANGDIEVVVDGRDGEKKVVIIEHMDVEKEPALKPYADMGKEDLLRFSETVFWKRARLISILIFWLAWLALLGAVIGLTIVAPRCGSPPEPQWWQRTVLYQVYIRSFYDSNNDGIGDLKGITEKLDYVKNLGVGAILVSSFYNCGGGDDFGYQVVNHTEIDATYGDLEDFELLINETHKRDMALILDFIPNYTSENHTWFIESKASPPYTTNYWNYYVWASGNSGPNNWKSVYGEPAWKCDTQTQKCYLHQFLPSQPELNLRSTFVQEEMENILRFWLDKGVDGFRVIASAYLFESQDLADETDCSMTTNTNCIQHEYTQSQPEVYEMIARWRGVLDGYSSSGVRPRVLLTDGDVEISEAMKYYGLYKGEGGAHLPINYQLTKINDTCDSKCVKGLVYDWLNNKPSSGTADWLTGDQDRSRQASYARENFVNLFNMIKMTLPGAALLYYGEEIGMIDGENQGIDPASRYNASFSRDGYRTPMQWTNGTAAGFTNDSSPWMPIPLNANADPWNVEAQKSDSESFLGKIQSLTKLRSDEKSLQFGHLHKINSDAVFGYVREYEGFNRLIIVGSFGNDTGNSEVDLTKNSPDFNLPNSAEVAFVTNSTMSLKVGDSVDLWKVSLNPGEGFIAKWEYERP